MGRRARSAAAILLIAAAAARAQDGGTAAQPPSSADAGPQEASEEIVVLGRLPQVSLPPSSAPAAVVVLDRAQLEKTGKPPLQELLAGQVPGLSLSDEQGNSLQPDLS